MENEAIGGRNVPVVGRNSDGYHFELFVAVILR